MDKAAIRAKLLRRMAALDMGYIRESDRGIAKNLVALPEFQAAPAVFAYHSEGREVDTREIIRLALEAGKTVALPVTLGRGVMEYAVFSGDESELEAGHLGIMRPGPGAARLLPREGDLILVPALGYDLSGYRLGRGAGYYDRYLCRCAGFFAGLCRERLLLETLPREAHDIPVDCLVTENSTNFYKTA